MYTASHTLEKWGVFWYPHLFNILIKIHLCLLLSTHSFCFVLFFFVWVFCNSFHKSDYSTSNSLCSDITGINNLHRYLVCFSKYDPTLSYVKAVKHTEVHGIAEQTSYQYDVTVEPMDSAVNHTTHLWPVITNEACPNQLIPSVRFC